VNSQYLGGRLESAGAPRDRIFVVPLAASEAFDFGTDGARRERSITTVGRLVEKKGIDDALRAFALAQDVLQGRWTYEILGDGSLRSPLSRLADELGIGRLVSFRGFSSREAVRSSLQRSRIFLLLSRTAENGDTEGTPIAIMEAGMARIPIVTTRHAGIPEMLPADGPDLGFVVEEGDVAAAADALRSLATDEEKGTEWGTRCQDYIKAKYGATAHVARLIEVLERQARVPAP
jgi:glycosyltransferase involved in cell wall biosynthesis